MTERENSNYWALAINAISIALVAVITTHVFHESCHAIAAVLVGARLKWISFWFGIQYSPVKGMDRWGEMIIAGNASLMNILTGMIAVELFSRRWIMRRPMLRLFLLYFSTYSLLDGFVYLVLDALIYRPGEHNMGDWGRVLDLLHGSQAVRIAMGLIGAVGTLGIYFWLTRSTLRFGEEVTDRSRRRKLAAALLMIPYLATNTILTAFSFWNPLGITNSLMLVLHWFVYIMFFVACLGLGYWTKVRTPPLDATPLPLQANWPWRVAAVITLGVTVALLLPTMSF